MLRGILALCIGLMAVNVWAISPYLEGDPVASGSIQSGVAAVESKLKNAGLKVVGKYYPKGLDGYGVVIATDEAMLAEIGAVGSHAILAAPLRVGVKADGSVTYTNPEYWYRAYFRKAYDKRESVVKAFQLRLRDALGNGKGLGGDESAANLASYRYMIGMERLDSYKNKLAEYGSFAEAVKAVRDNLAKGAGKTARIYEIVLADRKLAVFGVAMTDSENGDGAWVQKIDKQDLVAGLPYELYIVGNEVHAPHGRFRIALAYPDVGMGQFMRISSSPNDILQTMSAVAGAEKHTGGDAWQ